MKIRIFELHGGVRASCKDGYLSFIAGLPGRLGEEVEFDPGANWKDLEDGELVSPHTWFWDIDDGSVAALPVGPFASQDEALQAARKAVAEIEIVTVTAELMK